MLCKQRRTEWSTSFISARTEMLYSPVCLCEITTLLPQAEWGGWSQFGAERKRMTWEAPRRTGEVQLKKFMVMGNGWVDRTASEYAVVQAQWTYSVFSPSSLGVLRRFVGCRSPIGRSRSPKTARIAIPPNPSLSRHHTRTQAHSHPLPLTRTIS